MRKGLVYCLCLLSVNIASAHIGPKEVRRIAFPLQLDTQPWIVVKNLGVFLGEDTSLRWTCDESLSVLGGMNDAAVVGAQSTTWLVGDAQGLHISRDDGCRFEPVGSPFDVHVIGRILVSNTDPNDILVTTETLGQPNDLFRSVDGGETWTQAGLGLVGRIRSVRRSQSDPNVVYLVHRDGGLRSRDGGQTFVEIPLAPTGVEATGIDVDLLAIDPNSSDTVYASVARFPRSELIRSRDGGGTWESLSSIEDFPESLVLLGNGEEMLMATPILGVLRSIDGGRSWSIQGTPLEQGWRGCLSQSPDGQLWSCIHRGTTGLVMRSNDLGMTWETMVRLDLQGNRLDNHCDGESPAAEACAYSCEIYPLVCSESDSGTTAPPLPVDSHIPIQDGGVQPMKKENTGGGCFALDGPPPSWILALMLLTNIVFWKKRRS